MRSGASTRRVPSTATPWSGYREEEGVDARSRTETFVAMRLTVDNWRWAGVPVYIRTGKRLPKRATEVVLAVPAGPPPRLRGQAHPRPAPQHALILRIQPDEGICLLFGAKVPGEAFRVRSVDMDFSYAEAFPGRHGRRLRAAPPRRHDRRRHAVHPHRRGRARLADRRPLPRGLEPGRRAPRRSTRPARGARRRPTLLLARELRQWHEP